MARINFDVIFERRADGTLTPRQRIRVGGIELGPGVVFGRGVAFGGIDFTQLIIPLSNIAYSGYAPQNRSRHSPLLATALYFAECQ